MLPSVSQIWRGLALGLLASLLLPGLARAQWVSENYSAPLGYSAIWVGLDLSHTTIDEALAGKTTITEVWRWNPPSGPQFVTNPDTPVQSDTKWSVWKRGLPLESTLFQFTGNAAYLIRVGSGATVAFTLKGRPLRPEYNWNTTGVNFVGFAMGSTAATFTQFLSYGAAFVTDPTVLAYPGGALSNVTPKNPSPIINTSEVVARNKAYWVQATAYTQYYGPLEVSTAQRTGLNYGRDLVALSVRLKNATAPSKAQNLTVTLATVASETPVAIPAGTATMGSGTTAGKVASILANQNTALSYATPPTVTISAPGSGTTATATATLDGTGRIVGFVVTNAGAGYGTGTPTVSVTPTITAAVPLRIRGALNQETSTYAYTDLTAATPFTLVLTPGQETVVTVVVNRATMSGPPGALYGSLLRITDSLNYSKIDLGVSAVASDFTGMWAGAVALSQVDQIVGNAVAPAPGLAQATATFASGAVTGVTVNSSAAQFSSTPTVVFTGGGGTGAAATAVIERTFLTRVTVTAGGTGYTSAPTISFSGGALDPRATAVAFPMRLLLHSAANGTVKLVQQVYLGSDGITTTAATAETLFPATLKPTKRLSAAQFPSDFAGTGTGSLAPTGTLSFTVPLGYDSDSNPFVHRYHPDHDNLDPLFGTKLGDRKESWSVDRAITLTFATSLPGVTDPAWGVSMLGGTYSETVTGLRATPISTAGTFILYRVANSAALVTGANSGATGGTVATVGAYKTHTFTTSGTFTPSASGTVEVLLVGGGGGGGPSLGGGGGGGGVIAIPAATVSAGVPYTVVVGAGGASGTSGQASTVFGATAAGGGTSAAYNTGSGTVGGSGGGAAANEAVLNQGGASAGNSLGANTGTIYGNRGGHMTTARSGSTRAAGGGGAGGAALDTNSNLTGDTGQTGAGSGGVGVLNAILGTSLYWGGGGGGGGYTGNFGGWGGLGGGGGGAGKGGAGTGGASALNAGAAGGSASGGAAGGAGGANTGGGGGGGSWSSQPGGAGGSGIVVIRYLLD